MQLKKSIRKFTYTLGTILLAGFMAGCSSEKENSKTIRIAYPNWAEGIAMTQLVDHVLEDMGYDVELTMADPGLVYASMAEGSEDFLLDAWLPVTHESYMKQYGDNLEVIGTTFEGAKIGLVVPTYVDINSIDELNDNADKFDGQIIGIGQGAGIMKKTNVALKDYSLSNFELIPSSGPAMTTALGEAIRKNEPIVITGWQPHWMFARFDLKFLEDPKGVYGASEKIQKIARKGFSKDQPEVALFLKNMKLTGQQLGSLMDVLRTPKTEAEKSAAVDKWIQDHQTLVNSWKK
jgi:glycine betaine/proline transport system substrate-binding protein